MRAHLLLFALTVGIPAIAQDLAGRLVVSFRTVRWNSIAAPTPGSPGFIPGPWNSQDWLDADGLACFRRQVRSGGVESSADYYALNPNAPACRLLRARLSAHVPGYDAAVSVHDRALPALEQQLGPSRDAGKVHGWGAAYWRRIRQWDRDGLRILLFVRQDMPRVEILAEHQDILRAREVQRVRSTLFAELDDAVRAEVGDVLPNLSAMLTGEWYQCPFAANRLRATIRILLNLAELAQGERRAALLLAADLVAARLGPKLADRPGSHGELRIESPAALRFEHDHYSLSWIYKHDLLERVMREHPGTRWGHAAFALFQEVGWHFGRFCPPNPVFFPEVIAKGERFLSDHPESPYRRETVFQLAQAYEDWWNAGHAPQDHFAVNPAKFAPRRDEMRRKAIASYQQILDAEPETARGRWAALRLPRLNLSLRTERFRYVDSCH